MKAMKKVLAIGFVLGLFAMVPLAAGHASENTPIKLKWSTFYPAGHPLGPLYQSWAKEIEKRTQGRVKITFFFGGTMLKGPEIYEGIMRGVSDMGESVVAYTRGRFPATEAVCLPLGFPDAKEATRVANDFYEKFKPKEFSDVKVLLLHAHGPGILHSKKPIRTLEDVKGVKIRTDAFSSKTAQALGGVPVAMSMAQAYEALQRGVAEAIFAPMEAMQTWKLADVVQNTTESQCIGYTDVFYNAMNLNKWNALPKDIQKVFQEVSAEYVPKFAALWDDTDAKARQYCAKVGHEIIPLSKEEQARWVKAVQPVITDYVKDAVAKGLPGKEYVQFIREDLEKMRGK
jgi:TRAP-type C4-dicarboxylate transport system substrate-binding protein